MRVHRVARVGQLLGANKDMADPEFLGELPGFRDFFFGVRFRESGRCEDTVTEGLPGSEEQQGRVDASAESDDHRLEGSESFQQLFILGAELVSHGALRSFRFGTG